MLWLTKILILQVFFLATTAAAHAPEEGKVTVMAAPFLYRLNFGADHPSLVAPWFGGGGFIINGDVDYNGGLELTMFYLNKVYFRRRLGQYAAEQLRSMYIAMGYRHWLKPEHAVALAFFSSYPMGDERLIHSDDPANLIDTSARDDVEYGFDLSYQHEFWRYNKLAAAIDFRYSWSVTKKVQEDADHYGVLVGLKYQIREKTRGSNSH